MSDVGFYRAYGAELLVARGGLESLGERGHLDRVPITLRIGQTLQGYNTCATAENRARRIGIKRPARAIGRNHAAFEVEIAPLLREGDGYAPGEGEIGLAGAQALACLCDREERCRAGGGHRDGGPF